MYASAERRRIIDRVIEIYKNVNSQKPDEEYFIGFCIKRNKEINRLQIIFDDIPQEQTRQLLKHSGFRWSPYNKAWQRQLNNNGEYALKRVIGKLL